MTDERWRKEFVDLIKLNNWAKPENRENLLSELVTIVEQVRELNQVYDLENGRTK